MSIRSRGGTPRRKPGRALLVVVLGVALTTTSTVVACRSQPAGDFGAPPVTTPASSAPAPARIPVTDGRPPAEEDGDSAPVKLRIPGLDLDAAVDAVGIDPATGDFAVPPSVDRVGWYRFGPGYTASAGSIVIAGHVDSADEGKGAFFRLGSLEAGDEVTLTGPGGQSRAFEVVARERFRKTAIPVERYFARDGAVQLTLITCGGPFDPETRHYRDNVVVTAVPRS
ncbi:class F sortase [Actinoplanes sp. GCM10030250]|uniref:class F sortase n=1 Tax=Actinoplanes sp. GCM10030250 TaxID=3273376 RepID=UPI003618FFB1